MSKLKGELKVVNEKTNGADSLIKHGEPYSVRVQLTGSSDLLFHRWNCESIDEKSKSAKNSKSRKTDNIESYVWRNDKGELCIPSEYLRQAIIHAAKFRQDPRSPRKSAMDLFKASVVCLDPLSSLGVKDWDYEDRRRVVIQRNGVNRTRPAMKSGWVSEFQLMILLPEYVEPSILNEVITNAGKLVGLGDFRPTYGRFHITNFKVL